MPRRKPAKRENGCGTVYKHKVYTGRLLRGCYVFSQ